CLPFFHRDQYTGQTSGDGTFPGFVCFEAVRHHGLTGSSGKHIITQADNAPCRNVKFEVLHIALRLHHEQFALALCDQLNHFTRYLGRYIDHHRFDRLALDAIDPLDDHLWLADLKLIPFAAHGFNQYRQVKNTPAIHQVRIRRIRLDDFKGKVFFRFLIQAFLKVARRYEFTFFSEKRGVVDGKEHVHRRLIDVDNLQLLWTLKIGYGIADIESLDADHGTNIAGLHFLDLHAAKALKGMQFLYTRFHDFAIALDEGNRLIFTN